MSGPPAKRAARGTETRDTEQPARASAFASIASSVGAQQWQVAAAARLLDQGNTVPFIVRYRQSLHGGLDDVQVRDLARRLARADALQARRDKMLTHLRESGLLTTQLAALLRSARTMHDLEVAYSPYKQRRSTRAGRAEELGLGALADKLIANPALSSSDKAARAAARAHANSKVTAEGALQGALDIIASRAAEVPKVRQRAKQLVSKKGTMCVTQRRGQTQVREKGAGGRSKRKVRATNPEKFKDYFGFRCPMPRLRPHQLLAIQRGKAQGALTVTIKWPEYAEKILTREAAAALNARGRLLARACADGVKRLVKPAASRAALRDISDAAVDSALSDFRRNLRDLLLSPPLLNETILGVDPALKSGSKFAICSPTGDVLHHCLFQTASGRGPARKKQLAQLTALIQRFRVGAIAIGDGTGSRQAEIFVADAASNAGPGNTPVPWTIVGEQGASVYSVSELATQELGDMKAAFRGAVSIARRLQDPLAELVKIDPACLGVGFYQHDMPSKRLSDELAGVVESTVSSVGAELNTASPELLRRVAGLNRSTAAAIVAWRAEHAPRGFASRSELIKVKGLGPRAFEQAAGFVRIAGAKNALDNTELHPEAYSDAVALSRDLAAVANIQIDAGDATIGRRDLEALRGTLDALARAASAGGSKGGVKMSNVLSRARARLGGDEAKLRQIIDAMRRPGRDPRGQLPAGHLRTGVLTMDELKDGDTVQGVVRNVVAIGAFVDIGVDVNGLLHKSQMRGASLCVGQRMQFSIGSVDMKRRRIGLRLLDKPSK